MSSVIESPAPANLPGSEYSDPILVVDDGHDFLGESFSRYGAIIVAVLAIAASLTGLLNEFSFDDVPVILKSPDIHSLSRMGRLFFESYWRPEFGSFLYRPLTSVAFALEWAIGGGSPVAYHAVSIALYTACSVVLYRLARRIVPLRAALIAAAVFAVHPLHVEAVANVSGQGELWVALILLLVVDYYVQLRAVRLPDWRDTTIIALAYLTACGFKEHAIVLPALIAAAELLLVNDTRRLVDRFRALLPLVVSMLAAALVFVVVRHTILAGVADDTTSPLLRGQGFGARVFTMLSIVMEWVRLFLWPADLSADYSFSRLRVYTSFAPVMIPGLLVLVGTGWLAFVLRRTQRGLTFGLSWAGLALLIPSNLIVVTGFVLAERTLFLASIGVAICIGVGVDQLLVAAGRSRAATRNVVTALVCLALAAGVLRSATRNRVWHDNERLFRQTIEDVPSSGHAHWMLAAQLVDMKKNMPEALQEMELAVMLGGANDRFMLGYAGDLFATAGKCGQGLVFYARALAVAPHDVRVRFNAARCLMIVGQPVDAKAVALGDAAPGTADPRLQKLASAADSVIRSGSK
jgi:hypothetical protein